jgi:hypothetical protein
VIYIGGENEIMNKVKEREKNNILEVFSSKKYGEKSS